MQRLGVAVLSNRCYDKSIMSYRVTLFDDNGQTVTPHAPIRPQASLALAIAYAHKLMNDTVGKKAIIKKFNEADHTSQLVKVIQASDRKSYPIL